MTQPEEVFLYSQTMPPQHQHYVPQLLLRGFLSRDAEKAAKEQVHVLDLQTGASFTPPISKIMGERRYNDFWLDDETLATVEPAAGRIETHVTPLIERVRAEKRLERSPEEFSDLALLMAFQFVRTKKIRLLPEALNTQIKAHVRRMGFDPTKVRGLHDFDEEGLKREHVRHQLRSLEAYAKLIAEKEFFLMAPQDDSTFYIGDHPVVMHNDDERGVLRGGLGLGVPYIQIYMPLSADLMLCAYDKAILGQLMKGRDEEMKRFQLEALAMLRRGQIALAQMKEALESIRSADATTPLIDTIRAGEAVLIGPEQVRCYNSLQAFHAHRFVIDPDNKFLVAREVMGDRTGPVGDAAEA